MSCTFAQLLTSIKGNSLKTKEFSLLRRVINRCDVLSQSMNREQGSTSYFFTSWKFLQPSHVRRSIALNTEPKSKLFTSNKTERTSTRWHLSRPHPNDRKSNVIWIESTDTQEAGPDLSGIRPVQVRERLRWSSYWGGKDESMIENENFTTTPWIGDPRFGWYQL